MRLAIAIATWAFALGAALPSWAATLQATPDTWPVALKAAKPGDTIALSPGAWGDGYIANAAFAAPGVTVTSADPAHPTTFRSFYVTSISGFNFDRLNIAFTPDATTVGWSAFLKIERSHDVSWRHSIIHGGPAITGVPATSTTLDGTGNVIGMPTGYGVNILSSQDVNFEYNDLSGADRLMVLNAVSGVLIHANALHDRRRTAIVGANLTDTTVDGNVISGATPFNWATVSGVAGDHDHADMLAFWSGAGQTTPNARIKVTNNIMAQLAGANILGMWMTGGSASPFTDVTISGNLLLVPNLQGIMLGGVASGTISGNTLVQVPLPSLTAEQLAKQFPTIVLLAPDPGMSRIGIAMTNNAVGVAVSDKSGGANPQSGTTITKPTRDLGVSEIRAWLPKHPDMAALAAPLLR